MRISEFARVSQIVLISAVGLCDVVLAADLNENSEIRTSFIDSFNENSEIPKTILRLLRKLRTVFGTAQNFAKQNFESFRNSCVFRRLCFLILYITFSKKTTINATFFKYPCI